MLQINSQKNNKTWIEVRVDKSKSRNNNRENTYYESDKVKASNSQSEQLKTGSKVWKSDLTAWKSFMS